MQDNLGIHFIDVLAPSAARASKGKGEFRKRYFNLIHTGYYCSMKSSSWFVYIIQNEKGHYYTGITTDLERRFKEHSGGGKGAKFFNTGAPVEMVFTKKFANRSLASKFEAAVKKLSRPKKIELIKTKRMKVC